MVGIVSPLLSRFAVLKPAPIDNLNGCIAWWTFDDGTATDYSGAAQRGTLTNSPVIVPGFISNGLQFNGSSSYVIGKNLVNIGLATQSIWAKVNGNPASIGILVAFINGLGNGTSDKSLLVNTNGTVTWYAYDGTFKNCNGTVVITDNNWHHIAGTADGTNLILYIDGVKDTSTACGSTYVSYTVPNVFVNGSNGSGVNQGKGTYLACSSDDYRLYNKALSAAEINALYNQGRAFASLYSEGEMPLIFTDRVHGWWFMQQ